LAAMAAVPAMSTPAMAAAVTRVVRLVSVRRGAGGPDGAAGGVEVM